MTQGVDFWQAPLTRLSGVGPQLAARLARLDLHRVEDLLFHLPHRYQDRTRLTPIGQLCPGHEALVEGEVQFSEIAPGRRRTLLCRISDGRATLTLRFFHFSPRQQQWLRAGLWLRCHGEVRSGMTGLELVHPELELLSAPGQPPLSPHLTPIYPATDGVTQTRLRSLIDQLLLRMPQLGAPPDYLGGLAMQRGTDWSALLQAVHHPPPSQDAALRQQQLDRLRRHLAREELVAHQLTLARLKQQVQRHHAPPLSAAQSRAAAERLAAALPFRLTAAQQRVIEEIGADLQRHRPMQRLVQGDVGSGKTLVAAFAALQALESGHQVALMAPTELLARQHAENFDRWLAPLGWEVALLSGSQKGKVRADQAQAVASGRAMLAVGTHALFQTSVQFQRLGLVIIDEQHRFGVHQRLALRNKGGEQLWPHQLIMTATPIPRTLAMSAYADLDLSLIDQLPPGRQPITTSVVNAARRDQVIERIRLNCAQGRQVYWVCTLIDASEQIEAQAAADTAEQLAAALPQVRVGLLHGRMKEAEKQQTMARFKAAEIDLLVATTVIEVGVDVPNASLMIIENAERLGLSQLHQLRGRVGRGQIDSHCLLLYRAPLSPNGRARLAVMRESQDGFRIAEEDLRLRGPGELLGTRQTGLMQFAQADLGRDADLLPEVKKWAERLPLHHPELVEPLIARWFAHKEGFITV